MSAAHLREWRVYRGLTQRQLAARTGLALSTIWEIETLQRVPRAITMARLATALEADDRDLATPPRPGSAAPNPTQDLQGAYVQAWVWIDLGPADADIPDALLVDKAREQWEDDGSIEFDNDARVSRSYVGG